MQSGVDVKNNDATSHQKRIEGVLLMQLRPLRRVWQVWQSGPRCLGEQAFANRHLLNDSFHFLGLKKHCLPIVWYIFSML